MPFTYTDEERGVAIEAVLKGLRAGTPLTVICSAEGMPDDDTIRRWADNDKALAGDIARARETGFDALAAEAMAIMDAEPERVITTIGEDRCESRIDSASVQWAFRRAELRLKLLAKWDPKRYGDLIKHGNADGSNLDIAAAIAAGNRRVNGEPA